MLLACLNLAEDSTSSTADKHSSKGGTNEGAGGIPCLSTAHMPFQQQARPPTSQLADASADDDACAGCGKPFGLAHTAQIISALDKQWHAECFVCTKCSAPFDDGTFIAKDGAPYHKQCHQELFASVISCN